MSVCLGARRFGGGEIASGARFVLDDARLAERHPQMFGQKPRRQIGASARWKRNDDHDGLAGPSLPLRWNDKRLGDKRGGGTQQKPAAIDWHLRFLQLRKLHLCGSGVTLCGIRPALRAVHVAALLCL
jgi:hypothetical protein